MMLIANVAGGLVALLAYELLVMAPLYSWLFWFWPLLSISRERCCPGGYAPYAGTALNAILVLLGSAMVPFGDDVNASFIARLFDVAAAVIYVAIAFRLIEPGQKFATTKRAARL